MPELSGPTTYLEKLQFAQRVIRAAQFRFDQKQAIRELCEALNELVAALLDREQRGTAPPDPGQSDKQP
ncbi:MAG: hypothetical protein HYS12_21295 [Planctomycetes bacterium]|nr:hypothetical protein [Planctomycetota bacterium]